MKFPLTAAWASNALIKQLLFRSFVKFFFCVCGEGRKVLNSSTGAVLTTIGTSPLSEISSLQLP